MRYFASFVYKNHSLLFFGVIIKISFFYIIKQIQKEEFGAKGQVEEVLFQVDEVMLQVDGVALQVDEVAFQVDEVALQVVQNVIYPIFHNS